MFLVGVGIGTRTWIFEFLLAERGLVSFGLVRKKKMSVLKLLLGCKTSNFAAKRLDPFAVCAAL